MPNPNGTVVDENFQQREQSKESKGSKDSQSLRRRGSKESKGSQGSNLGDIQSIEELNKALSSGDLDDVTIKFSRAAFADAECCPAVILMNHGRFEDLSLQDVIELFNVLDEDRSGLLDFEEIGLLCQEVLDPPCTADQVEMIYELTDKNEAGVTPDELFRALTAGPVKEHLIRLQRENRLKNQFEAVLGINQAVDREQMIISLKKAAEKADAFKTLPFSVGLICVFIFLVIAHLKVWERQQVERGLQDWITGYGGKLEGPYFLEHVNTVGSTFDWLRASGLPAILGGCQNNSTPLYNCQIGTRNLLLGDLQLRQTRTDGSETSVWLLHSTTAEVHLSSNPGDFLGAATAAVDHLSNVSWADAETMDLHLRFVTYGQDSKMFATSSVTIAIDDYDLCSVTVGITAVVVRPYPDDIALLIFLILADLLYVLFFVIPMVKEARDIVHLMRLSGAWDGLVGYCDLWNIVDWVVIIMSMVVVVMWILTVQAMQATEVQSLLLVEDGEWVLTPGAMQLDVSTIEVVTEKCANIYSLFFKMHLIMGGAAVAIMLKCFKGFQANPRLQLVTNTLVKAASDIFHFSVVFLAVFLGFAVTGHILFGNDLVQFRSFGMSIDTCFIVLMGEFGWYEGVSHSDDALASGLPFCVVMIWFWSYMIFVLLIMINMLLAIVLEHYTELVHEVSQDADAVTLWKQTSQYMHHARTTKDHIKREHLLCELQDDDAACHPEAFVTQESLQRAFPKMGQHQAEHLINWLKDEARKADNCIGDEKFERLRSMGQHIEHLAADLHVVKLNTAVCTSRLKETDRGRELYDRTKLGPHGPNKALVMQHCSLHEQVEGLTMKINEAVKQMSWQIGGATDKLLSQGSAMEIAADDAMRGVPEVFSPSTRKSTGNASSWLSQDHPMTPSSRSKSPTPSLSRNVSLHPLT